MAHIHLEELRKVLRELEDTCPSECEALRTTYGQCLRLCDAAMDELEEKGL